MYVPICPPLFEFTNTNSGIASSGNASVSTLKIGEYASTPLDIRPNGPPFFFMYLFIFLVTRFSGDRIGASVTHSGGKINRACRDRLR
jgi:hypothetical protein